MLAAARSTGAIVLARAFGAQASGFYIDIGATADPDSVTAAFHERGWRGVNLTPSSMDRAELARLRPRDVTLRLAFADPGGGEPATLRDVCARHAPDVIDFLTIAADTAEEAVLRGGDWTRHRPRIVLVEAADDAIATSAPPGEPVLLAAGYRLALFDGSTRIYVPIEEAALLPRLAAIGPDDVVTARAWQAGRITELERQVATLRRAVGELETEAAEWARHAGDVQQELEGSRGRTRLLERNARRLEEHLGLLPDTLPPTPTAYPREAFVRFLYAALLNRTNVPPSHLAHWAGRLRAGATMLEIFETFLASPEGHHLFWTNPFFERYRRPTSPGLAFVDVPELAAHLGVVKVVDVGGRAGAEPEGVYGPMTRAGRCSVVGVEPRAEARHARRRRDPEVRLHPYVAGDGSEGVFYRLASAAGSSLYRPDVGRLQDFAGLAETFRVIGEDPVGTVRLDDLEDCRGAAFLTLAAPGAALDVLRGAPRLLRDLLVLHVTVEFAPLRARQPLFGDVETHLRAAGFELYTFPHLEHGRYGNREPALPGSPSRLLGGDAVFVPIPERIRALPVDQVVPLCWIMHELYRAYDFCRWLLGSLDAGAPARSFVRAYDRVLASIPR